MKYQGSCHCGGVKYEVEGDIEQVMDCNCSMCRRRGALLWFVKHDQFKLLTPDAGLGTYKFNKHLISHHFCPTCGLAPFSEGKTPRGGEMVAINVRCLEGVDLAGLKVRQVDGARF